MYLYMILIICRMFLESKYMAIRFLTGLSCCQVGNVFNCFVNVCNCCNCLSVQLLEFSVTSLALSGGGLAHSPHRISAGGSLLFMRCVSLTLTGLVSAWRRGEAPSSILAKPLSECVTLFCLRQCKSTHLNVCEILKKYMLFSNKLNILHS